MLLSGIVMSCVCITFLSPHGWQHTWPMESPLSALAFHRIGELPVVQVTGAKTEFSGWTTGQMTARREWIRRGSRSICIGLPADAEWRCEVFAEFQVPPSWSLERGAGCACAAT